MAKILIVVDMQKDFVNGPLGTQEAVAIVPKVIEKIKNFDGSVIYTRDTHHKDYLNTQEGKNLPVEHCIEKSLGWELVSGIKEIQEAEGALVFDKETFGSAALGEYLKEKAKTETIEEISLVGLCTDICVISNAMLVKAFLPEVPIVVDASCCAGVTKQSHENALKAMEICQIRII